MKDFARLGLSDPLVETIEAMGFETATPIQAQAIPRLLQNDTDFIGLAQTGTGKTAAFGLPLIELVDVKNRQTQALVLAPTRELCLQITKELMAFGRHLRQLRIVSVYGGADIKKQITEIRKGAQIVVATPGRLRDLMRRKVVDIRQIQYVVLDEADEMLNMGFKEEIDEILEDTPDEKLTWLFSATMPNSVRQIATTYMSKPVEMSAGERNTSNRDIAHQYVWARPSERYDLLRRFIDADINLFGLVFTRTRRDARELAEKLSNDGYNADALHGDLNQRQRDLVMDRFRRRKLRLLVATDVAARGIDVQDITHVFHYNIPDDMNFYTHRSGRTGRAGRKGISLILAHPKDKGLIRILERRLKVRFELATIPSSRDILEQRLHRYFKKVKETTPDDILEEFLPQLMDELDELTKEELVHRIVSYSFRKSLKTFKQSKDYGRQKSMNNKDKGKGKERDRGRQKEWEYAPANRKQRRLFINIGTMDVSNKGELLDILSEHATIERSDIGKLEMNKRHTFFQIEEEAAPKIIKAFRDSFIDGRSIRINDGDQTGRKNRKGEKKFKKKKGKKRK
ncbi:MAG: DEAD/DEAH box helicase [Bacteroidota bacterium]